MRPILDGPGSAGVELVFLLAGLALAGALGAVARVALVRAVARLQARLQARIPARIPVRAPDRAQDRALTPAPVPQLPPAPHPFPAGTLTVNALGAFIAGGILGAGLGAGGVGWLLLAGFFGAFTTFSTWMVELRLRPPRAALIYLLATLLLGVGAAAAGMGLGSAIGLAG